MQKLNILIIHKKNLNLFPTYKYMSCMHVLCRIYEFMNIGAKRSSLFEGWNAQFHITTYIEMN